MRSAFVLLLALATPVMAEELYLPVFGEDRELRVVNPTGESAQITIELLEGAPPVSSRQLTLAAGESIEWRGDGFGVFRITCTGCEASPALDARDAIDSGTIARLQGGVGIVNPNEEAAGVTVSLWIGERVVEEQTLQVPARGVRLIRADRLFKTTAENARLTFGSAKRVLVFGYSIDAIQKAAAANSRRRSVRSGTPAPVATPKTVALTPSKDNTLFESASGSNSNGAGIHLFSGMTAGFARRRALVAFDVASQIPAGSQITRVTLKLRISKSISGQRQFALHRVSKDWGQGTSNAGGFRDGAGAAATNGDATWIHASRPNSLWTNRGGDFTDQPDAETVADFGEFTFESSAALIARVQSWADQPSTNFGWILIGDESEFTTAKVFESREVADPAARPTLTIEYLAR